MSTTAPIALTIAGAPAETGLNGLFFLVDVNATGRNRIWRNETTGRVYYDGGWQLGDLISQTSYFSEVAEPNVDTWKDNPWDVDAAHWKSNYDKYIGYEELVVSSSDDPGIEEVTIPESQEPKYTFTLDKKFNSLTTYYVHDDELNKYIRLRVVVPGNKIEPDTFFEYDEDFGVYSFTTDPYFLAKKTYYLKVEDKFYPVMFINTDIPTETVYEETGTIITTTHKIINKRTGETTITTSTVTQEKKVVLDERKRYYAPELEVGQIYRFAFVKDFKYLGYMDPTDEDFNPSEDSAENDSDVTRGVFKVTNILTYYKLISSGIDVYQNLYLPLSIPKSVFEIDRKAWMNDDIWYELTDPAMPARVFYVPLSIINGIPDANVKPYDRYQLLIDIGVFNNPDMLTEMITDINMLMKARFGIPTMAKLASYDTVFLPDEYYERLEQMRKENINDFMTNDKEKFYDTLFRDEYNKLYQENMELKQANSAYEEIIAENQGGNT